MSKQIKVKALIPLQVVENGKKVKKPLGCEFDMAQKEAIRLSKKPKPSIQLINEDDGKTELQLAKEEIAELKAEIVELKALLKDKPEKVKPESAPDQKEGALLRENVRVAGDIIANTQNIDLLKTWDEEEKEAENRKTVLQAIEKRISELMEGGE